MSLVQLWCEHGRRKEAALLLTPVYNSSTDGFDASDLKQAKARLEGLA